MLYFVLLLEAICWPSTRCPKWKR